MFFVPFGKKKILGSSETDSSCFSVKNEIVWKDFNNEFNTGLSHF